MMPHIPQNGPAQLQGQGGAQQPWPPRSPWLEGMGDEPSGFTPPSAGSCEAETRCQQSLPPLLPSSTGSGALPGRCWHHSSPQALQTALGKIFNLSSYFNLKCEKIKEEWQDVGISKTTQPHGCSSSMAGTSPSSGSPQQLKGCHSAPEGTLVLKSAHGTELQRGGRRALTLDQENARTWADFRGNILTVGFQDSFPYAQQEVRLCHKQPFNNYRNPNI